MGIPVHTIEVPDGLDGFAQSGWAQIGLVLAVPYGSATATNNSTVAVAIPASANLPPNYAVFAETAADVFVFVTAKTATGLTVNVTSPSGAIIAAGSVNLLIVA